MVRTILEYQWVKVFQDGRILPQFDENGKESQWMDDMSPLVELRLVPFTPEHAEKICQQGQGALASALPPFF